MENSYLKYLASWLAFITIVIPILSPIFLIVYIFRTFVEIVAKLFRKDLVTRLNSSEYISSIDKLYKKPFSNDILLISTKESLTLEQVQHGFTKNVLEKKTVANDLQFAKLFLYPKEFCSYFFWKKVQCFDIKQYTNEVTVKNECNIDDFLAEWIMQPYGIGKSPWEIALIRIQENNSSAIALKMHNVISHNYSFSQVFNAMIQNEQKIIANYPKHNVLHNVNLFLMFPFVLFKIYMQEIENHENVSTRYNTEMICSRVEISKGESKCLTTSSLSEALRRLHIEEKCNNNSSDIKTAKFSSSFDPILRLLEANNSEGNDSNVSEINRIQVPFLSILPKRILRAIFGVPGASVIRHTSMPYSVDEERSNYLWGKLISDVYFITGLSRPNWGVALSSTPSVNKTGCCIIASKDVIPNQNAASTIMQYFKEEVNQMLTVAHYS